MKMRDLALDGETTVTSQAGTFATFALHLGHRNIPHAHPTKSGAQVLAVRKT